MRRWFGRSVAIVIALAAIDAALAGIHGTPASLLCASGAAVLSILGIALLWNAPALAAGLNALFLAGAFAAATVIAGGPGAPGGLAFTAAPAGFSSAIAFSVAIAVLAAGAATVIRQRRARAAIAVIAMVGILSSVVVFGRPRTDAVAAIPAMPAMPANAASSSIASEVSRTGKSIGALLARVSDGIRYEIYPGVFRGPAGTLADGAGNDADKALLLHDLIASSNPGAALRFATCTLSSQQSDELIAAAQRAYRAPVILANAAGKMAGAEANPKAQALLRRISAVWSDALAQDRDHSARLAVALQSDGAPIKAVAASGMRPIAAQHVWLQMQTGGKWVDLDPSLPHAAVGSSLCAAQATMPQLPPQQYVNVTLRVREERRTNGALSESTVLQAAWTAAQLSAQTLTFMFAEPAGIDTGTPAPVPSAMAAYTPVIRAGDALTPGQPILMPAPPDLGANVSKNAAGAVSAAAAMFGTPTPVPAPTAAAPAAPEITAVWLEIAVSAPAGAPVTVVSPIFDRIAFADRAAGRGAQAELAPIDESDGIYTPMMGVWNVAVSEGTAIDGAGTTEPPSVKPSGAAALAAALGRVQRSYYAARRALFASAGASHAPIGNVQPSVDLAGLTWHSVAGKSAPAAALLMDVAADHAAPIGAPPDDTVTWGVSSLLAERLADGAPRVFSRPTGDRVIGRDVLTVFDWAPKENIGAKIVRSAQDLSGVTVADDARARIEASLADGSVAYVPTGAVTLDDTNTYYGWWTIGADGSLRDEMQDGRHQELEGEGETDIWAARWARWVEKNGRIVRCVVFGVAVLNGAFGEEGAEGIAEQAHAEYELEKEKEEIEAIADAPDDEQAAADCAPPP